MAVTRKTHAGTVKATGDRVRTWIISTDSVDRDGDVVSVSGWVFDNFLKNPVVLWAHDYDEIPIGRASNLRVRGSVLLADVTFAPTPEADTVLALVDAGVLNAASVGFRPLEYTRDEERGGLNFLRQELLEFSIVPVPSNPDALIQRAHQLGVAGSMITKMFGRALAEDAVLTLRDEEAPARRKAGARHSAADRMLIDDIHERAIALGSRCDAITPPDDDPDDDEPIVVVDDDDDQQATVTSDEVRAVIVDVLRDALSPTSIRQAITEELARRRGRITDIVDPLPDHHRHVRRVDLKEFAAFYSR